MTADEKKLSTELKSGIIQCCYYFCGEEVFLTDTYTRRIISKTVGKNADNINLVKFSETFTTDQLADSIESLPFFAEHKLILIKDFDCEKFTDEECDTITELLSNVPDECTVVFSQTGIPQELLAKKRAKSFIDKLSKQKNAYVCRFSALSSSKIAEFIIKKAAKSNCTISRRNAEELAEMTLNSLTACSAEVEKLCSYVGSGEITAEAINKLVMRLPDAKAYSIGTAIAKRDKKQAFMLLDDLYSQRVEPVIILSSLSGAYIDFYRASCAKKSGKTPNEVAADFSYPKNRAFLVGKAFSAVSGMSTESIKKCIKLLKDADLSLKSTGADSRTVLEKTIAGLLMYA